ncbi:DUF6583 family protein [Oceanobacillus damuensis]|uniref:DUF6583 family protein n=1 Tax=Oceanobacillus damuensis TaxID=937928 RepID=UPI00083459B0|nr:DUF6583 family protein [Oceanobacillus damuensis]
MEESTNGKQKKGVSKGIIALIAGVIVLVGGSAAAFMLSNASPKASYFLAEKNTIEYGMEQFENRYEPELDWYEKTQTGKSASTLELSAEYNDTKASTGYGLEPAMFINNSSITIDAQTDMDNRQIYTELKADFGGMEIDGIQLYLTEENVMLGLPFLEEVIQMDDEDLGPLLYEADPTIFSGEEKLGLDTFFDRAQGVVPEEDIEYLKKEYLELIYDELPEEAFTSADETVNVNGESINAEKITLQLSEQQLKDIVITVLDKAETDDRLKEIVKEQLTEQQFGSDIYMDDELELMMADFEAGITEAKQALADLHIPEGLTSVIWVNDNKIVQRDFAVQMGPSADELAMLSVKGTQLLTHTDQFFNYDLAFSDAYEEASINISGDLNWENNQATDVISLTSDDFAITYDGQETLEDGTRDFNRTFSLQDPMSGGGSLIWSGNAAYDNDQMNSQHSLSVELPDFSQDMFSLNIVTDGRLIDSVETMDEENVKYLGGMSAAEIQEYFEYEVTPSFQQWIFGIMAGGAMGF